MCSLHFRDLPAGAHALYDLFCIADYVADVNNEPGSVEVLRSTMKVHPTPRLNMVLLIVQFVMGFIGLIFGSYLLPSTDYPILEPLSYIIGGAVSGLTIHAIGCEGRFTGSLKNTVVATSQSHPPTTTCHLGAVQYLSRLPAAPGWYSRGGGTPVLKQHG